MLIGTCEVKSETAKNTRAGTTYVRVVQVPYSEGFSAAGMVYACKTNADPKLYAYGDTHPDDADSVLTDFSIADPSADGDDPMTGYCDVTFTFSPFDASYVLDPLARPAEIDWGGGEDQTEVMDRDFDGTAVRNSASDRYDPMPEWDIPGADFTITRYEADNPADLIALYSKSTNSAIIWGQAVDSMKFGKITTSKVYENNVAYWKVRYPVFITSKDGGWRLKLVDNGYRIKQTDGTLRRHSDDLGQHSPVPVLLDGAGGELAAGGTPVIYPTDGYKRHNSQPWAVLSLPNPFA